MENDNNNDTPHMLTDLCIELKNCIRDFVGIMQDEDCNKTDGILVKILDKMLTEILV